MKVRDEMKAQREDYVFVTIMPAPDFDCFESMIKRIKGS